MLLRRILVTSFLAPFCLGGCGAVSTVRTAFEMPVAPTPSSQELARARQTHSFDSLSKSLQKLDSKTVQTLLGSVQKPTTAGAPTTRQPGLFASNPAGALANDLSRGAPLPLPPRQVTVAIGNVGTVTTARPPVGKNATQTLAARHIATAGISMVNGATTSAARAFLQAWAARESLRRSDEELLGRRALEDRIALQSRSTRPIVDLSLVSPATQLELSNLRLKLLPLLTVPIAQRASAAAQIEAIETRLNQIWQEETTRQNALLRQSLVEVPARLRAEGETALELQTRAGASQTQARLAQVRRDLALRAGAPASPALGVVQDSATAPDPVAVRGELNSPVLGTTGPNSVAPLAPLWGTSEIARRGAGTSSSVAQNIAAKNQRVWSAATR